MILVVVKHAVRPEVSANWFELVKDVTDATRAEPGCISFEWFRSLEDPNVMLLVEAFTDADAGKRHVESEHFQSVTDQLPRWLASAPEIIHVETSGTGWSTMAEVGVD